MSAMMPEKEVEDLIPGYEKPKQLAKTLIVGMLPTTRKAFLACWGMHRHLPGMESPLALATMVSVWCRDWGLAEADAETCLRQMCSPERMAAHKFTSDLTTDLSALVTAKIKFRETQREMIERRGPDVNPDNQAKVKDLLADFAKRMAP